MSRAKLSNQLTSIMVFLVSSCLLASAAAEETTSEEDQQALRELMETQASAMTEENHDKYINTLHPDSPFGEATEDGLKIIWEQYDLKVALESIDEFKFEGDNAWANVRFKTCKVKGPAFKDNVTVQRIEFRKLHGHWLMFGGDVNDIQFIDCK